MIPNSAREVFGMNQFSSTPYILVSRSGIAGRQAARSRSGRRRRQAIRCRILALIGMPFRNYMERRSGKQGNPEDHSE
jgi:hypothetical protein